MCEHENEMNDIVDIDKNEITLEDIEFISKDEMSQNEYVIKFNNELYSDIFLRLTHRYFSDDVAKMFWRKVLTHRDELIIRLKRDPGLIVACLDYLTNVEDILINATIIEEGKSQYIITTNLIDNMTKLFIRSVFDIIVKKETEFSLRANTPLALIMIDIDDFKKVNDNFGHQVGDNVLSVVGRLILDSIRTMDIACRYGGEELAVIMPNTDLTNAEIIADRIRKRIAEYEFKGFKVTVSIGLSIIDSNDNNTIDLVHTADKALYTAKRNGKNRVVKSSDAH